MTSADSLTGDWYRCVAAHLEPLSSEGARRVGGRFNPPGLRTLCLAGTPTLAVAEHLRLGSLHGLAVFPPRLLVTVRVELADAADLRIPSALENVGLTGDDLSMNWVPLAGETATQRIGRRLAAKGVEGVVYPSAVDSAVWNLAVFVDNLREASIVEVVSS